ncbi:RagB/SusD family nutrient uptake outer membrane protein [Plebeiibacterium sediminum]|uniref:RagB/SusD family nutrient uptake outer membrane protein n=1 Tax=Plebeiibacterium sediminum TaxID=2992112 RepID=A0AAE3M4P8_9BACT|nr:RagB/SusD family nutrient uptake outer membrane protein [Plebeiobacterium sediminum]MCW3786792.1 RagB/SusD family nutrient uptake outer membrane protein [Plebeiobacterium sediminum]
MKRLNIIYIVIISIVFSSCNDFLDETPDNRAQVDSKEKIQKLLVSAYPTGNYALACELSSDNIYDTGESNPNTSRILEQYANWEDITEEDNEDLETIWSGAYGAIANSNLALSAIEEIGEEDLLAEKGEALITRAFSHFLLVNIFCKNYNSTTSGKDLGIPYMEKSETTLDPKYERGTVREVYEKINADIEAALPLISDDIYEVGLYHFTRKAAYAFAARFNLYYENWQKAYDYATIVLGDNPVGQLRDWVAMGELPRSPSPVTNAYISDASDLLALPFNSGMGLYFGAYYRGSRYSHTNSLAYAETLFAGLPWSPEGISSAYYNFRPFVYSGTNIDKTLSYKIPYLFEYTDAVAGIGYYKTVMIPFHYDETLLVRAEAAIMLENYSNAVSDLNNWAGNFFIADSETTLEDIDNFYADLTYSSEEVPTSKKVLQPGFSVVSGTQENLIQYVLQCRRILTIHEGLRWFDVKRYGIEIVRYQVQANGGMKVIDVLTKDDPRRALQIPMDVITAGIEPNPRN